MKTSSGVIQALASGKRVRIHMPESDGLNEGRKLVRQMQKDCGFHLAYFQNIGAEPYVLVWRFRTRQEAMKGHEVEQYHA